MMYNVGNFLFAWKLHKCFIFGLGWYRDTNDNFHLQFYCGPFCLDFGKRF